MERRYSRCPVVLLMYIVLQLLSCLLQLASAQICANLKVVANHDGSTGVRVLTGSRRQVLLQITYRNVHGISGKPPEVSYSVDDLDIAQLAFNDTGQRWDPEPLSTDDQTRLVWDSPAKLMYESPGDFTSEKSPGNESADESTFRKCEAALMAKYPGEIFQVARKFEVEGVFIGKTWVRVRTSMVDPPPDAKAPESDLWSALRVYVLRSKEEAFMTHIFVGVLTILIIIANIGMGCKLSLDVVWSEIKKPVAPLIGLCCQFVFMPLLSYGLGRQLFNAAGMSAMGLGMFVAGSSPGGGASNFWTLLLDGNVDLSITMTFISTLAALAILPFWMFTLGPHFLHDSGSNHIKIPYKNILISLAVLVVPLVFGILIRRYLAKVAEVVTKALRAFLILIILFICTFGVYANWYMMRLMTWRVLIGGLILPWAGFAFGLLSSLLFRQSYADVVAIAIETGVQNTGIAIMLLKLSFSQPDNDLGSVVPVVVSIFTPAPLLSAVLARYLWKCYKNGYSPCSSWLDGWFGKASSRFGSNAGLQLQQPTPDTSLLQLPEKGDQHIDLDGAVEPKLDADNKCVV